MPAATHAASEAITLSGTDRAARGGKAVRVGPRGFVLLAMLLRTGRARLPAVKLRGWGSRSEPDSSVSQAAYRLNLKLEELGDPRRVAFDGGDVVLA